MHADSLGDRMKDYEGVPRTRLTRRVPVIIRVDGKAFHTLTRGMDKPYDDRFIRTMLDTASAMAHRIQGCRLAYVQSDEISLLLTDWSTFDTQAWFDYDLQKIVSVTASLAAAWFNEYFLAYFGREPDGAVAACFDARAWSHPRHEVVNYFVWRQQDAVRNSILGLAQSMFSHAELHGKNTKILQEMLFQKHGVSWNDQPTHHKRGACITRAVYDHEDRPRTAWVVDMETPVFTQDRNYIESRMEPLP